MTKHLFYSIIRYRSTKASGIDLMGASKCIVGRWPMPLQASANATASIGQRRCKHFPLKFFQPKTVLPYTLHFSS